VPYAGIELPWSVVPGPDSVPVFDLTLGNRQLYPWKLWYTEIHLAPHPDYVVEFEYNLNELRAGGLTVDWYGGKQVGEREWITLGEPPEAQVVRSGWGEGKWSNVWYAEYYFEPQPDFENITWTFNTDRFVPGSSIYVSKLYTGTACSPEPVTVALLALGLPVGLLARRRRKE
jgi:hypothetical protein